MDPTRSLLPVSAAQASPQHTRAQPREQRLLAKLPLCTRTHYYKLDMRHVAQQVSKCQKSVFSEKAAKRVGKATPPPMQAPQLLVPPLVLWSYGLGPRVSARLRLLVQGAQRHWPGPQPPAASALGNYLSSLSPCSLISETGTAAAPVPRRAYR